MAECEHQCPATKATPSLTSLRASTADRGREVSNQSTRWPRTPPVALRSGPRAGAADTARQTRRRSSDRQSGSRRPARRGRNSEASTDHARVHQEVQTPLMEVLLELVQRPARGRWTLEEVGRQRCVTRRSDRLGAGRVTGGRPGQQGSDATARTQTGWQLSTDHRRGTAADRRGLRAVRRLAREDRVRARSRPQAAGVPRAASD